MNFNVLNNLVEHSKLNKAQIAERAHISRTTLDNALNGADVKVSTIESLADVLGVNPSVFFSSENEDADNNQYEKEIKRLQSLLDEASKRCTKVVVELDVTQDEFVKMGLKDKVIQILNK